MTTKYLKYLLPYPAAFNTGKQDKITLQAKPGEVYLWSDLVISDTKNPDYNTMLWESYIGTGAFSLLEIKTVATIPDPPVNPGTITANWDIVSRTAGLLPAGFIADVVYGVPTKRTATVISSIPGSTFTWSTAGSNKVSFGTKTPFTGSIEIITGEVEVDGSMEPVYGTATGTGETIEIICGYSAGDYVFTLTCAVAKDALSSTLVSPDITYHGPI